MTAKLLVLAGSTREGSYNRALSTCAAEDARIAGAEVIEIDLREWPLPIYEHHIEIEAYPSHARELKRLMVESDGFLIATPEYNGSVSGILKNVIDWASRPGEGETLVTLAAFRGKAAGIMSASIGPFGGLRALMHLRQILNTIQVMVAPEQVAVPFADKVFESNSFEESLPRQLLKTEVARVIELAEMLKPKS